MIHIVLFEPEIPANTGNIMRTCGALGAKLHLIEPLGFYLDDAHKKRAAMDYGELLEIVLHENLEDCLKQVDGPLYCISRYGHKSPDEADLKSGEHLWLFFGKESSGLPMDFLKAHKSQALRIPMVAKARSLNLANSVAIILYEALRQRGYPALSKEEVLKGSDWL
ncbi:MAG: tRNA (cytidine(34)-2'-O)-methyltransferase [Erysipelotrichaceae bacterium]|jgi:tRNA (cytidine/uridine-2'-O-)-methyltransferase|nr:tRNA (cytidine(34)-2'-O)-methyltransferase [Erysipelotrichaceae bacterium]